MILYIYCINNVACNGCYHLQMFWADTNTSGFGGLRAFLAQRKPSWVGPEMGFLGLQHSYLLRENDQKTMGFGAYWWVSHFWTHSCVCKWKISRMGFAAHRSPTFPWIPLDPLGLHPPNGRPSFSSRDFNASLSKCLGRFFRTNVVLTKGHCAETHPVVSFINPEESL